MRRQSARIQRLDDRTGQRAQKSGKPQAGDARASADACLWVILGKLRSLPSQQSASALVSHRLSRLCEHTRVDINAMRRAAV